jgi:hypothetical protein
MRQATAALDSRLCSHLPAPSGQASARFTDQMRHTPRLNFSDQQEQHELERRLYESQHFSKKNQVLTQSKKQNERKQYKVFFKKCEKISIPFFLFCFRNGKFDDAWGDGLRSGTYTLLSPLLPLQNPPPNPTPPTFSKKISFSQNNQPAHIIAKSKMNTSTVD